MKTRFLASAAVCVATLAGVAASAQTHVHPDSRRERYMVRAVKVDQTPRLDGVLDEAV